MPSTNSEESKVSDSADDEFVRLPGVLEKVGLGRTAWLDLVRRKEAPQPVKIGRSSLWVKGELRQFVRDRVKKSRGAA